MRKYPDNRCSMIRFMLLILIIFSSFGACSSRKKKLDNRNLIPEKELTSILTEVYIANGLLSLPRIHNWFSTLDSLSSYNKIFEKHGYTKENMDRTMNYYYIKKPKELIKIYDQVLGILSEMESHVEKEAIQAELHKDNLWKGKEYFYFPDPAGYDSSRFDISLNKPGLYTLSFSATFFPDDQAVNPRMTVYSSHADSIETGKRTYLQTAKYIKDGQPHIYSIFIQVPENTLLNLRGWFYDFDNLPDEREKHARIADLTLYFIRTFV
jgi:hypothetical protein